MPTYSFVEHTREAETKIIEATPIVILEAVMLYHTEVLRNLFVLKLFVDISFRCLSYS